MEAACGVHSPVRVIQILSPFPVSPTRRFSRDRIHWRQARPAFHAKLTASEPISCNYGNYDDYRPIVAGNCLSIRSYQIFMIC